MKKSDYTRREFLKIAGAGAAAGVFGFPSIVRAGTGTKRVIVLGIDGMDPDLASKFIASGRMPNAAKLAAQGAFMPLRTANPPQSPVAWSCFISGTNPGGHGIYDFIARDPETMLPFLAGATMEAEPRSVTLGDFKIPLAERKMINLRKGPTFWDNLADEGIDCTVFRVPGNFPPTDSKARTLSGLGTPDVHGSYGIFTHYTSKRGETTRDVPGGRIERVAIRDNKVDCILPGPVNSLNVDSPSINVDFTVHIDPSNAAAMINLQGKEFILREGEWSDWQHVNFEMIPHVSSVSGICRLLLRKARNDFSLYVSPVNIDPADPVLPLSTPASYAQDLARNVGPFYTQGMPEDTSALSASALSDDEYRHQAEFVLNERKRFFDYEFNRFDSGFFFYYFSSLDLNSHAFWRAIDPTHPVYTDELHKKHGDFLPWLYSEMDSVIGKAMAETDENTMLIVMSDHGFGSFKRQFNLNSWLLDNGYAKAAPGADRGAGGFFSDIQWRGTQAYGMGLNGLYLNLAGREKDGTVSPGEKDALLTKLAAQLKAEIDPKTGEQVVTNVYQPGEIYSGPYLADAPDLLVCYNRGYRASWDTILGKYPKDHLLDNLDPWSGDHIVDAALVPGVIMSNRKIDAENAGLEDIAPTILKEFGVPAPSEMTGKPLI